MTDLQELRRLAEAAGMDWRNWPSAEALMGAGNGFNRAHFIAACTPATILALLRVIEAADIAMQYRDGRKPWPDNYAMMRQFDLLAELIAALKEAK